MPCAYLTVSKASKSKQKWRGQLGMMIPFFGLLEADTRLMVERAKRKCLILFSIFCLGTTRIVYTNLTLLLTDKEVQCTVYTQ